MIPTEEVGAARSRLWLGQAQFHQVTQREFWRAAVKCLSTKFGAFWLIRQCFLHQPNLAVKRDADACERFAIALWAPLTSALGFRFKEE